MTKKQNKKSELPTPKFKIGDEVFHIKFPSHGIIDKIEIDGFRFINGTMYYHNKKDHVTHGWEPEEELFTKSEAQAKIEEFLK